MSKHAPAVSLLLFLLWVFAAALPAAAKDRAVVSAWAETAVMIDGQNMDWAGTSLQTSESLGIDYAFKNDGSNLFVLFIFNDPRSLSSIEATGMTLYISPEMKKSTDRGLRFLKKTVTPQELVALLEKEGQILSEEGKRGILSRESYAIFECHLINKKGVIIAENVGRMTPNPPSFNLAKKENSVIYEFRVPLARTEAQPAGIGGEPGMSLKVGFFWGGLTAEMKKAVAKQSGYDGGQAGMNASSFDIVTEDIGLEGADSASSFGSRMAQLQRMMKKHEFWVDVLLAAK